MRKRNLEEALMNYYMTGDDSFITQDVYDQFIRFCTHACKKYYVNNPIYTNQDELMSIVNQRVWISLKKNYDPKKSNILTFITMVIDSSILMDIRSRSAKIYKNLIYLNEIVKEDDDRRERLEFLIDNNNAYEELISKETYDNIIKQSCDNVKIGRRSLVYKNIEDIINKRVNGYSITEIALEYNVNLSVISNAISEVKKYIELNGLL